MKSKGTQTMQKIVIKKPWGVEIKDYKAGDPIPAGVKFKIFDAKDTDKIEAYADSLDESADYQKERFKEPAYMYEAVSRKNIKSPDDLYEWLVEYMRKHSSNRFTTLQIILGNGNNITFAWDMKANKGIHEGDKDYTMSEFVYKFMDPVIKNSGISDIWEIDMDTGRFKPTKESYYIKKGPKYFSNVNGDPVWWPGKDFAIPFKSTQDAEKYMDKMSPLFDYDYSVKVVKESTKITEAEETKKDFLKYVDNYRNVVDKAFEFDRKAVQAGNPIDIRGMQSWLDAYHSSMERYNNAVKSKTLKENKTVGIISLPVGSKFIDDSFGGKRTMEVVKHGNDDVVHVKEVGTGRKFAYDASTPGGNKKVEKIEESFIITGTSLEGKPLYVSSKDGKSSLDKAKAVKFDSEKDAEETVEKMRKDGYHVGNLKVVSEGRIARGYENLDADERAKHLLSHPSSKYMSDLKSENITERAIRKAVKEMLGKPAKDDPQFITDVNEEGEAPAIANTTAEVANPELPLKLKEGEDELENHIKYQTSVAGGMGTDAENAESAQEHDDKVVMVKEHNSFRKFLKESLEDDKAKALEDYKQAKAKYLSDKSDENWKNFIETKNRCMSLGVRI